MSSANVYDNLVEYLTNAVLGLKRALAVRWRVVEKRIFGMLFLKIFWFEGHGHQEARN